MKIKSIFAALCGVMIISGCGSFAEISKLSGEINPTIQSFPLDLSNDTVVSIQYPMLSSEATKRQLVDRYPCRLSSVYGNDTSGGCGHSAFTGEFAPMLFEQSTYHAAELKKSMARYIDEKNIYLEPMYVDYKDDQFYMTPVTSTSVPSSLVIELYDFPDVVKASVGSGSVITASVRSAGRVSSATCGHIFVTGRHLTFYGSGAASCAAQSAREVPRFSPLQYFADLEIASVDFPKHEGKPVAPGSIMVTGALWEPNDDEYLKKSAEPSFQVTTGSIRNPAVEWLARAAANALLKIDTQAAFDAGFAVYLKDYDAALASRFQERNLVSGDDRKIAVVRKLLNAERDWLATQNAAMTEGILNGNYGKSFRQTRWVLAQAYNKSQALGWLQVGAVLAGGFSSGLFGGAMAYNPSMLMLSTLQTEQRFSSMQNQIEQALLETLAPGVEMRSKVVQVSLDGVNTALSGASHSEIRSQLLSLYKKLTGA